MLRLTTLRLAGLAAALSGGTALAADMLGHPPPPPMLAPPPAQIDVGSGFYLRGDVGAALQDHSRLDLVPPVANSSTLQSSLKSAAFVGVGVGYQFNPFFRTDATIEYRASSRFSTTRQVTGLPPPDPVGWNITRGNLSGVVGLANAYVDLGTWNRITPFIGGGIGFATMMTSDVKDAGFGAFAGGSGSASTRTETRFAWAIHAGLGYDLTTNIKAEAAYRYLNIGDVTTGRIVCTVPCTTINARIKNLESHDLKVGLRYVFADTPIAYSPGPLARKY
ncbi:MAG: porin family protein [Methylobacterium sp.]|nr:porin family protein [Methylobacterium sp.]MCA3607032.1 porin family protein [Methylobacterium sp.]MCA3610170.1 porin family protein [Methylobacterium sp.]MCA3617805.1 porin family protein [Methylobacterium sp.]MCA3619674.1 porin family protein [Methylobacterium sp.]